MIDAGLEQWLAAVEGLLFLSGDGEDGDVFFRAVGERGNGGDAEVGGDFDGISDGEVHPGVAGRDGAAEQLVDQREISGFGGEGGPVGVGGGGEEDDAALASGVDGDGGIFSLLRRGGGAN